MPSLDDVMARSPSGEKLHPFSAPCGGVRGSFSTRGESELALAASESRKKAAELSPGGPGSVEEVSPVEQRVVAVRKSDEGGWDKQKNSWKGGAEQWSSLYLKQLHRVGR